MSKTVSPPGAAPTAGSTILSGDCLVCGRMTTSCCGGCKPYIDRIFFCSKEHQQLVWPAHKLVCGKKSHPFCLPPLTQEEADRAQRYLLEKTPNPQKQKLQFKLLAMCFGDMLGPRDFLQSLVGKGGPIHAVAKSTDHKVMRVRKFLSDWDLKDGPEAAMERAIPPPTVETSAACLMGMMSGQNPPTNEKWYSEFCHRHFIHLELGAVMEKKASEGNYLQWMLMLEHCHAAGIRVVNANAAPSLRASIVECWRF